MQSDAERKFKAYMRGFTDAVSGQIHRGDYSDEDEWMPYHDGWESGRGARRRAEKRAGEEYGFDPKKAEIRERLAARKRLRTTQLRRVV